MSIEEVEEKPTIVELVELAEELALGPRPAVPTAAPAHSAELKPFIIHTPARSGPSEPSDGSMSIAAPSLYPVPCGPGSPFRGRRIYIHPIPHDVTAAMLRDYLQDTLGPVVQVAKKRDREHRPVAFVDFLYEDAERAKLKYDCSSIDGILVRVDVVATTAVQKEKNYRKSLNRRFGRLTQTFLLPGSVRHRAPRRHPMTTRAQAQARRARIAANVRAQARGHPPTAPRAMLPWPPTAPRAMLPWPRYAVPMPAIQAM